ncbi:hypothetical protein C8R42DRAFT_723569 [Lentinula raphanica]|nr:hypothetical protein C8R42DRAFT_723569 [Lentinula raphanica]
MFLRPILLWYMFCSSHLLGCFASPLSPETNNHEPLTASNSTKPTHDADEKVFLGYRYLRGSRFETVCVLWEYMKQNNQLTDVPAKGSRLGEGAYIGPSPGKWSGDSVCGVWANKMKFEAAQRASQVIPDEVVRQRIFISEYLETKQKPPKETILVSAVFGDPARLKGYQMLIPPYFLRPSLYKNRPGGEGDLGINVRCIKASRVSELAGNAIAHWEDFFPELKDDEHWKAQWIAKKSEDSSMIESDSKG